MPKEKILVTGAGGFIGGWIAETLFFKDPGCVRAGVHSWAGAVRPARFPMEIVPCDLMNREQVSQAVAGVNYIIHCAKGPSAESIIQGTRNVLEAALQQKVKRVVYLSTAEIYGKPGGNVDETIPPQMTGEVYGDSKIKAEQVCQEYNAKGLPVTIIRPSIVYGPFSKTWSVNIAQKLRSGNWGVFEGQGDGFCNLIYITDLVAGILLAMRDERAAGEAFNLNGPDTLTWNDYFEKFNDTLGYPRLKVIPSGNAKVASTLMDPFRKFAKYLRDHFSVPIKFVAANFAPAKRLMKFVEVKMKTSPQVSDFSLFNRKAVYVSAKSEKLIGFKPTVNLEAGLKKTAPWLKQAGWVD